MHAHRFGNILLTDRAGKQPFDGGVDPPFALPVGGAQRGSGELLAAVFTQVALDSGRIIGSSKMAIAYDLCAFGRAAGAFNVHVRVNLLLVKALLAYH